MSNQCGITRSCVAVLATPRVKGSSIKFFLGPNGYADAINSPWISSPVTETIKATRWVTDAFNKEGGHLPSSHSGVQGLSSDPLVMTLRDIQSVLSNKTTEKCANV